MESVVSLLAAMGAMSPLAVIALLGTIIFLLVKGKTAADDKVEIIANNHLHGLPEMAASLERIETLLQSINDNIIYVRARVNGQ